MKKIVCLIAAILLLAQGAYAKDASDYPQKFWDVSKDHWAFVYIADLADRGVINGYEDGSFKPSKTVTRAEWSKIMVDAAGVQVSDDNVYFTDMANHWANEYINAAKNYLTGYTDGSYRPDQAATREDVTVAMVRLKGYDLSEVDYSNLSKFTDVDSISNAAKGYVSVALQNNLISGFEDNTFRGQDTLTRAEAATLLYRAFQHGNADKTVTAPTEPIKNDNTSQITPNTDIDEDVQPIPEENKKSYKLDTLKSVSVRSYTYDGKDDIYYLTNKEIYKLNALSGDDEKIYDTSSLTYKNENGAVYSAYEPTEVVYDKFNNRLILNGFFTNAEIPFKGSEQICSYIAFNVTDDDVFLDWDSSHIFRFDNVPNAEIKAFIGKDKAVLTAGEDDAWFVNTNTLKRIDVAAHRGIYFADGKDLYIYARNTGNSSSEVKKYNFSEAVFEKLLSVPSYSMMDISNGHMYLWNGDDEDFYKINLSTGKTDKMNISADNESCDVLDMLPININRIEPELITLSDDYIVFYDNAAEAFRFITKNN